MSNKTFPTISDIPHENSEKIFMPTNILWGLRNKTFNADTFSFKADTSLSPDVIQLDVPNQFFKYFYSDDLLLITAKKHISAVAR